MKMKNTLEKLFSVPILLCLFSCSGVFYQPDRNLHYPPEQFQLNPQNIQFLSGDGTHLTGWFFVTKQNPPKGTLIQFHGNAENISSHYLSLIWMIQSGYNLFVFDYRGYGRSEGNPTQEGTYLDALAALNEGWRLHQLSHKSPQKQFIVYGQSLGGAIAMRALTDFDKKDKVDLVVMDSTFLSYRAIARKKLTEHWYTWPLSPLATLLVSDDYSAEKALTDNKIPLLVIHDKMDPVVPFSCGQEIFDNATSEKHFWILNNGKHISFFSPEYVENRSKFLDFLSFHRTSFVK